MFKRENYLLKIQFIDKIVSVSENLLPEGRPHSLKLLVTLNRKKKCHKKQDRLLKKSANVFRWKIIYFPPNPIISKSSEEIIFKYVQNKTSVQLSSTECFNFFTKAFPLRTCLSFSDPFAQDWPVSSLKPVDANIHPLVWPLCSAGRQWRQPAPMCLYAWVSHAALHRSVLDVEKEALCS